MIPYDLDNMNAAYERLYEAPGNLQPTHYYLKWEPSTPDEFIRLTEFMEANDYVFEQQPMHFEVVYEGEEGYVDTDVPEGELPPLYGAVTAAHYESLPAVPYQTLNRLHYGDYLTKLTFVAFVISGNERYYEAVDGLCHPDCPTWPDCLEDESLTCQVAEEDLNSPELESINPNSKQERTNFPDYINDHMLGTDGGITTLDDLWGEPVIECGPNCVPDLDLVDNDGDGIIFEWFCNCWDDDSGDDGNGGGSIPDPNLTVECDCEVFIDEHKPGGKISVLDTQTGLEGVRRIKVMTAPRWFTVVWKSTDTNDEGCWRIDHSYSVRRLRVKAVFKDRVSGKLQVRGMELIAGALWAHEHVWLINGGREKVFNDLCLDLTNTTRQASKQKRSWVAATVNNATHEFYDDHTGFPQAGPELRILIGRWFDRSSMPMFHVMDSQNFDEADIKEFLAYSSGNPIVIGLHAFWQLAKPDMFFSYKIDGGLNDFSDDLKQTVYHELTHASQYALLGKDWWQELIFYTIIHGGYGTIGNNGSGRAEIIESLAFSHEEVLNDRQYGLSHSNSGSSPSLFTGNRIAERLTFWSAANSSVTDDGSMFIPEGIPFDLFDTPGLTPASDEPGFVVDGISNITYLQQLSAYNPTITTYAGYRAALRATLTPSQLPAYDALFNSYGK